MKTSVFEVHDMLSVLPVDEVEKRICGVPGVESATVNYAAGNATVRYDETLLEVADIKVIVHQRGHQPASETQPINVSEHEPARKPDVVPTPKVAPVSASETEAATPKTPTGAAATAPAIPFSGGDRQQGTVTPNAVQSATQSPPPKPSQGASVVKPSTALAAAPKTVPDAKSSAPTAAEQKPDSWKVNALSMTVTMSVAYTLCAIFDVLFPPFGLLAALAPGMPFPISGSPFAYLTGFALFTFAGFAFGAIHGIAWKFWSKRIRG